jgi:DNA polymerase III epsilon subunit family exonuclease
LTLNQEPTPSRSKSAQNRHAAVKRTDRQQPTPLTQLRPRPHWLNRPPRQVELVFFDLETTGGNPSNSEVIEIAAIKERDGKEIGRFQSLVNPRRHIPRTVREITGIDQNTVRDAPVIEDIIDDLLKFIGEGVLISHGVLNDFSFIAHYARTLRARELHNFYVCTHLLVSNYLPNVPVKSLSGVANYFSLPVGNAHRAMADAEMTRDIFWEIQKVCEKNGFKSVEDLLKIQADNQTLSRLGPGLLSHHVEKAPSTPGLLYLFNSSREVTYMSATANMRRSLMNVTELSDERDFNRLLVDVTDFKFERCAHFLAALLQENKELKKLELSVDPRRFERRAENTIQILLPDDLLNFWKENPSALPYNLPDSQHLVEHNGLLLNAAMPEDATEEDVLTLQQGRLQERERNQYVYAHLSESSRETQRVPIQKTKRLVNAVKNSKYQVNRQTSAKNTCVHMGHLVSGTGWFFGPIEQPKVVRKKLDELITLWPFHDNSVPIEERVEFVAHFMAVLLGKFDEEIARVVKIRNSIKNIFNPIVRMRLSHQIELLRALKAENYALPDEAHPKTGITVITNTDTKDLDVCVVVQGRIRNSIKLPIEESDKLKSRRFFTRLMSPYHHELWNPSPCRRFTEEICNDLELFSHWIAKRRGEGEWVDFETLAPLYNPELSE